MSFCRFRFGWASEGAAGIAPGVLRVLFVVEPAASSAVAGDSLLLLFPNSRGLLQFSYLHKEKFEPPVYEDKKEFLKVNKMQIFFEETIST